MRSLACLLTVFLSSIAWGQDASAADEPPSLGESLTALHDRGPSSWARAELVAGQALHGFAQGMASCNLFTPRACPDGDTSPVGGLVGAAIGGGAAYVLSWNGVRPGQAMAINAGTLWGAGEGIFLSMAIGKDQNPSPGAMLGMLLGTGAGVGVALTVSPDASQVALVDSGTLWAGLLTFFAVAFSPSPNGQAYGFAETAALTAGLACSSAASLWVRMSRARLFIIDGGGFVGLLVGLAGAFYLTQNWPQINPVAPASMTVTAALVGLGLTAWLTRTFDLPTPPAAPTLLPSTSGRPGFGVFGTF